MRKQRFEEILGASLTVIAAVAFVLFNIAVFSAGCEKPAVITSTPHKAPGASVTVPRATSTQSASMNAVARPPGAPTATPASSPPVKNAASGHEPPSTIVGRSLGLQAQRWHEAKVKASAMISVNKAVMLYERTRSRYEYVEKLRPNGVPAPVIFALHMRESDNSFSAHLHEGSSLLHRTKYVPKGRLPPPSDPPYKWEVSAEDAIYVADKLQGPWANLTWALDRIESYNGLGYRKLGIPSPYLYAGTNIYTSGKFVSDGHFNGSAIDQQLGVVSVLLRMQERGIAIAFAK